VIDETDFICLSTLPKSGTHYSHHFLVNYLRRLVADTDETLFEKYALEQYPNRRYDYINRGVPYRTTGPLPPGVRDIVFQHGFASLEEFPGWIIAQTRNPLDFIVSQFYYRHQARIDPQFHVSGIGAVVENYAVRWAQAYRAFEALERRDRKLLHVRYEALVAEPGGVFREMLRFVGQPIVDSTVDRTIADIQVEKYRQASAEMTKNPAFTVPLARNGANGQWRTEMSDADVRCAEAALHKRGYILADVMASYGQSM